MAVNTSRTVSSGESDVVNGSEYFSDSQQRRLRQSAVVDRTSSMAVNTSRAVSSGGSAMAMNTVNSGGSDVGDTPGTSDRSRLRGATDSWN